MNKEEQLKVEYNAYRIKESLKIKKIKEEMLASGWLDVCITPNILTFDQFKKNKNAKEI